MPASERSGPLCAELSGRLADLTRILVSASLPTMAWAVTLKESVLDDLRWFGRKDGRRLLRALEEVFQADPLSETRNLKTLRPNPVAQRELRIFGKYRVLLDVEEAAEVVTIVLVGEKQGNTLIVQGQEFTAHHESDSAE
jgi:mRNA-degrading endonuclease RelE of RelBE toxin-antitoxin system